MYFPFTNIHSFLFSTGIERCCGELVAEIVQLMEAASSRNEHYMDLVMRIYPELRHYYAQLESVDGDYARQCVRQYKAFVKGPPNRRTRDRGKHLASVTAFFDGLIRQ
jgi:hypothetical protein